MANVLGKYKWDQESVRGQVIITNSSKWAEL